LYATFPDIVWAFVYVDDFAIILPHDKSHALSFQIINFLHAIGLPISLKKVAISSPNSWLGYIINCSTVTASLTPDKQTMTMTTLQALQSARHMTLDDAYKAAGRLNWATMIYPIMRPFLQPIYKWVMALVARQQKQTWGKVKSIPTAHVKLVCSHLSDLFLLIPPPHNICPASTDISAATDAGSRQGPEGHESIVGGWYTTGTPSQGEVWWFSERITPELHPWAYADGSPQRKIAALELYGSLLMYRQILSTHPEMTARMQIPLATDNRGNSYQVTNHKAKNCIAAAMLMELSLLQHRSKRTLKLDHVYREHNEWADQLTHENFSAFNMHKRIRPDQRSWSILDRLITVGARPPTTTTTPG
jgi:hypothetical protein